MHTAPRNLISSIVLAGVLGTLFALPGTAQEVPGPLDSEDVSAFVSRVSSSLKNADPPIVADMMRKRELLIVSSGTCQATPRSLSE